ncbi:hypothetical protein UZ36_07050 [Candidatus Nitromaritima sp. SCGC AAA799-C22]|nr:hypothetical protein UZ36_07050 [Candidatus Nitromaritima sp. SCGC AAA799-C22]
MSKACDSCSLYKENESYQIKDLIPEGHCFELLHSLLPYLKTFERGGWFKWERTRDKVVVCCPAVEDNVCVELKKISSKPYHFQYNIMNIKGRCPYYSLGSTKEIREEEFKDLCRSFFNVAFPHIKSDGQVETVTCGRDNGKSRFELIKNKSL